MRLYCMRSTWLVVSIQTTGLKGDAVLSWDWAHSIMWYMTRMIFCRLDFPIILAIVVGNAASISALVVNVGIGVIVLGVLSNANVLALYLLVGRFLSNNSQNL